MASKYYEVGSLLQNLKLGSKIKSEQAFLACTVILLTILALKRLYLRRFKVDKKCSFHRLLPRVQSLWIRLPLVEAFLSHARLRNKGVKDLEYLAAKYGPNFVLPAVPHDVVLISDPEILKKLLSSTNSGHLNKPKFIYEILFEDILKDGIVVADFETWSPHRKSASKAFTYNSFPTYLKLIHGGVRSLVQQARTLASADGRAASINNQQFTDLLEHHSLSVTTAIIMGSKSQNMTNEDRDQFTKAFSRSKDIVLERIHYPYLMIRPIWWFHKMKREYDEQKRILSTLTCKMISNFRNVLEKGNIGQDESQSLNVEMDCDASENCESEPKEQSKASSSNQFRCLVEQMIMCGHNDKEVLDTVNGFLIAGNETVVMTLNLLLFHLAANKHHQENCRKEVDELFDLHAELESECLTMTHLSQLKYVERCILESLRITPTGPFVFRRVDAPLEISDDCALEAGTTVMICPWALHRNPEIYPNPTEFNPDRFLPENVQKRHSHAFIPFSMGPRNCIGWRIALLELKVYITQILRHFEITTMDRPDDVKLLANVTVRPERLHNLEFKLRNH